MGYETPATDDEIKNAVIDRTREVTIADGDPVSEQLLEDIRVEDGVVTFTVAFERLNRTLSERLTEQLRGAGLATTGVEHVRVEAADAEAPESGLPVTGVGSLIAVGSAKGGVGKTTVTAALARALDESGLDVAVFDANVYAPDAPDLLGAAGPVQTTPTGRPEPVVADGIEVVSMELISDDGPVAWRGAMVHDVLKDLLGNAPWSDRDVLLVDLPPGIGDAVYTIVQQAPLDGALLVSTPTDAGARATERRVPYSRRTTWKRSASSRTWSRLRTPTTVTIAITKSQDRSTQPATTSPTRSRRMQARRSIRSRSTRRFATRRRVRSPSHRHPERRLSRSSRTPSPRSPPATTDHRCRTTPSIYADCRLKPPHSRRSPNSLSATSSAFSCATIPTS